MAYRFLLEVPDALYAQANVVITSTPDADIVDVHEGIGGDFDNQGKTLTLVSYSLDLVARMESWFEDVRRSQGDIAPVNYLLTNGRKLSVGVDNPHDVIAAIRRDQPWVERSIPKIGDHATRTGPAEALGQAVATAEARAAAATRTFAPRLGNITILATEELTDHPVIEIENVTMLHLPVVDLTRPERDYGEIFGAAVVDRANRDGRGGWQWLGADSSEDLAAQYGNEPDYAFIQNGPLTIALERAGRAYPLDVFANVPSPVRLMVDDASFENIKAEVLVRNWNVFDDTTSGVFGFRDPYGYTWSIHSESFEKEA